MDAPRPADVDALLAQQDWAAISRALARYAYTRTGKRSWSVADDLAQEAIRRVLEPGYSAWSPEQASLLHHLGSIVNSLVANARRSRAARARPEPPDAPVWETIGDGLASPENRLDDARTASRALRELRERVATDPLVAAMVELGLEHEGTMKPAEIARATGCNVDEVYKANRRLSGHLAAIRRAIDGEEQ